MMNHARAAFAVGMILSGLRLLAQTSAGINGSILDSSGALIPGAHVVMTNLETDAKRETVSNDSGAYQIPLLQPGAYSIAARKQGFKQVTRDIRLELNQVAEIDFNMETGAVSETVEVQALAPLLEPSTSSVGQVIETKAVSDLPLNGRNFAQLAILGPGVTHEQKILTDSGRCAQ